MVNSTKTRMLHTLQQPQLKRKNVIEKIVLFDDGVHVTPTTNSNEEKRRK
jgi:hypothetical protein